jgi:two-component system sensor histidine kinase UhpB
LIASEKRYRKLFEVSRVAGELIKENNSRLELAMQSANMAWWGMDIVTGSVTFDKRKSGMLGFPAENFKHYKDFMELVNPDDYDRVMNAMRSYLYGTAERYVCEYRMLTKSGKYLWFYDVGTIIKRNSKGAPLSLVGIVIDITERKETENELFKAKEKAEKSELDLISLNQHLQEVRENERAIMSREIHDQLGQSLTALKIDIDWLRKRPSLENETKAKLKVMIEVVTNTIRDVQRISSDLRPPILDDLGLASAMEWYCEDFSDRTGLLVKMEFEDVQFEDMNHNLALFRVLQESLTNIIRHAHAKTASVLLFKSRKKINLVVQDDGKGIPSDKIRSSESLGLMGMFERVKYAGGEMNISNPASGGTKISVIIPLKNKKL